LVLLPDTQVFRRRLPRERRVGGRALQSFADLRTGYYVVHEDHGIGNLLGFETKTVAAVTRHYPPLGSRGGHRLYVLHRQLAVNGKQVLMLAPTTILAEQHWHTFRDRFRDFPIRVEMISRFRKPSEVKRVLRDFSEGKVEVLIGTHRILSRDVIPKELGLVVLDEEQRFGVAQKELLKSLRLEVDVLTLSATPIPRTLHLSLSGMRDISIIETPP